MIEAFPRTTVQIKNIDPDREGMPAYDESIFYPAIERRKLGITDEDMECIVEFYQWHIHPNLKVKFQNFTE
jgi:hypothetical protein